MEIRYPPNAYSSPNDQQKVKIFLAGSIEMGKAIDWQKTIMDSLSDLEDVVILNPSGILLGNKKLQTHISKNKCVGKWMH